jgi:hypothetical protein
VRDAVAPHPGRVEIANTPAYLKYSKDRLGEANQQLEFIVNGSEIRSNFLS